MPFPNREYIAKVFALFESPPEGNDKFFDYVDPNVWWQVTGKHRFSGIWTTRQDYYNATWANINKLLAPPGYKLVSPNIIVDPETGWSVIEMRTVDVKTRSGVTYDQHYSWHCRWNEEGKIVEAKAFLDADHLEKVLGGEMKAQGM